MIPLLVPVFVSLGLPSRQPRRSESKSESTASRCQREPRHRSARCAFAGSTIMRPSIERLLVLLTVSGILIDRRTRVARRINLRHGQHQRRRRVHLAPCRHHNPRLLRRGRLLAANFAQGHRLHRRRWLSAGLGCHAGLRHHRLDHCACVPALRSAWLSLQNRHPAQVRRQKVIGLAPASPALRSSQVAGCAKGPAHNASTPTIRLAVNTTVCRGPIAFFGPPQNPMNAPHQFRLPLPRAQHQREAAPQHRILRQPRQANRVSLPSRIRTQNAVVAGQFALRAKPPLHPKQRGIQRKNNQRKSFAAGWSSRRHGADAPSRASPPAAAQPA